jgi:hypothetical protein
VGGRGGTGGADMAVRGRVDPAPPRPGMTGFRITPALWDRIHHFASFPQTGVSLQQMVLFGENPSQGTLLKASQFLAGASGSFGAR